MAICSLLKKLKIVYARAGAYIKALNILSITIIFVYRNKCTLSAFLANLKYFYNAINEDSLNMLIANEASTQKVNRRLNFAPSNVSLGLVVQSIEASAVE